MNPNDQKDTTSDTQVSPWYTSFLLPAGLIFLLLLAGALYFGYQSYSASKVPKLPTESPSNINYPQVSASGVNLGKSETAMNAGWYNEAYKTGNAALCEKITIEKDKKSCLDSIFEKEAGKNGTIATCDKISDESRKNRCKEGLYYREAIATNNNEICKKISEPSLREQCINESTFAKIRSIATGSELDVQICNAFTEENEKNRCVNQINAKKSSDALIEAQISKDVKACSKILDIGLKGACESQIILDDAIKTNDLTKCSAIDNKTTKAVCINEIQHRIDQDSYQQASATKNIEFCDKISAGDLKNSCRNDIFMSNAVTKQDANLCTQISDPSQQSLCIQLINTK